MRLGMMVLAAAVLLAAGCLLAGWMGGSGETAVSASHGLVLTDSAMVLAVETNSRADRAGVQPGDQLLGVAGCQVNSREEAREALGQYSQASFTVRRSGTELSLTAGGTCGR